MAELTAMEQTVMDLAEECGRLTAFLHSRQLHPDFDYSVTYPNNNAHTSREGWSPNPHAVSTAPNPAYRESFWMRRKETSGV